MKTLTARLLRPLWPALHHRQLWRLLRCLPPLLACAVLPPAAATDSVPPARATAPAPAAGSVLMVSGDVSLTRGGQSRALLAGSGIEAGDLLTARADGRAYLRFADGSFVILRPGSVVAIEDYRFDPAQPEQARVRFSLRQGVVRTITGAGLQAHKDRFRLNTPLAAIGVRGTDFTTYAADDVVRVSVHQGGVVMAPYAAGCLSSALGPCAGEGTAELFATAAQMLELRKGQIRPSLVPATQGAPDSIAPPHEGEPLAGKGPRAQATLQEILVAERIDAVSSQVRPVAPPEVAPPPPLPVISLDWGRWANLAGLPAATFNPASLPADKELVAINSAYALVRDKGFSLPAQGNFTFALQHGEAWLLPATGAARSLAVTAGSLDVDFGKRSFATQLSLADGGQMLSVRGAGDISRNGQLVSTYSAGSNATVRGALGGQGGSEAAYIFQQTLSGNQQVYGAAHWTRR